MTTGNVGRSIGAGLLLLMALLVAAGTSADARDLAAKPQDMLQVELATIGLERQSGTPVVLLREPRTRDVVPIFIGVDQARAMLLALHDVPSPRPMTHDLMRNVISAAKARLVRVLIDDVVDGVYLGMLELRLPGQEGTVMVDARPSDGLILAARTEATVLVSPKVLEAGRGVQFEGLGEDEVVTALGITVVEAEPQLREAMELPDRPGVLVSRTAGAAAGAGMKPGSLILSVNGETPETPMDFLQLVRRTPEDTKARIVYWQEGGEHEVALPTDVPIGGDEESASGVNL